MLQRYRPIATRLTSHCSNIELQQLRDLDAKRPRENRFVSHLKQPYSQLGKTMPTGVALQVATG